MEIWYTWLGFFGLICGLVVAALFEWPAMRSALVGFAAGFRANEIPDKSRVNSIYTHNLKDLLNLADLKGLLEDDMNENSELRESWATISKWSEQARYQVWTLDAAAIMLEAVGAADKGLLQWLQKR
jgi:hypothetical protein